MQTLDEIRQTLPSQCRILAVSKLQPESKIRLLADAGQKDFAENYIQEACKKQSSLADLELDWHFIGHLQKNKIKEAMSVFELIHSIDSKELAETFSQKAASQGKVQKILLQLNLAGEATKGGFSEADFEKNWELLHGLPGLQIMGLMTMPPLFENPEQARPFFKRLRHIRDQLQRQDPQVHELSMGTSSDYHIAAQEGATWIRLGTLLFGERSAR